MIPKILSKSIILKTPWIKVIQSKFKNKDDNESTWTWVQRVNFGAVMIVPYLKGDSTRLILLKEWRVPLEDWEISFPAGLIEKNEDIEVAAQRELLEETGFSIKKVDKKTPQIYNTSGLTDEKITLLFAEVNPNRVEMVLEENETIEVLILDRDQILELMQSNVKFSAKSWLILDRFIETGKAY